MAKEAGQDAFTDFQELYLMPVPLVLVVSISLRLKTEPVWGAAFSLRGGHVTACRTETSLGHTRRQDPRDSSSQ